VDQDEVSGQWREAVRIVRAADVEAAKRSDATKGRATIFDFTGAGEGRTWIGAVRLAPGAITGGHHHGKTEVALYVVQGEVEVRWGDGLAHSADLAPGDFAYFTPFVPHQEHNKGDRPAELVVVRSDGERIVVDVDAR
jgi:uncharacterized RmlC-like cupin family protein